MAAQHMHAAADAAMLAAPKKRGRQAAMEQLAEKQMASAGAASPGGPPVASFAVGGGMASSAAAAKAAPGAKGAGAAAPGALARTTFAERVADVKDNVERARAEYRSKAVSALGSTPGAGKSAVTAGIHNKFSELEAKWGEVMDYTKIDPWSTATPGVNAAALNLARNPYKLDQELSAVVEDLWDGVSAGAHKSSTEEQKDRIMRSTMAAQGTMGGRLSPGAPGGYGGGPGQVSFGGTDYLDAQLRTPGGGMGLAIQMPAHAAEKMAQQQMMAQPPQQAYSQPPAGAQDFETRRQLEIMRNEILRLEDQVLAAVEQEEADLPPPPPLVAKNPAGLAALTKAWEYDDMVDRIKVSVYGAEPSTGETACNSVDNPSVPLIKPPVGGMGIRKCVSKLEQETKELREMTIHEFGGEAARTRMKDMQREMKADLRKKR